MRRRLDAMQALGIQDTQISEGTYACADRVTLTFVNRAELWESAKTDEGRRVGRL
jgi:hypothetical protein